MAPGPNVRQGYWACAVPNAFKDVDTRALGVAGQNRLPDKKQTCLPNLYSRQLYDEVNVSFGFQVGRHMSVLAGRYVQ